MNITPPASYMYRELLKHSLIDEFSVHQAEILKREIGLGD